MDKKFTGHGAHTDLAQQTFWLGRVMGARQRPRPDAESVPESRHSLRRELDLNVLINHGLTYSVPSHVRDLSLTGAYVQMDTACLPQGSYVEVMLRYRYKGKLIEHRLPATVTRSDERGMALTFGKYDDKAYTDLTNLLFVL